MSTSDNPKCLVILAGGQSRRMGIAKATMEFGGQRLIDRLIARYKSQADHIILSAPENFETGLEHVPDDPDAPGGPVGAIFTLARAIGNKQGRPTSFVTVPVDAPFAPVDLIAKMRRPDICTVAEGPQRMHPTFACWQTHIVDAVRNTHQTGADAPSLHWLARQCHAETVSWENDRVFLNINTPEERVAAEKELAKKPAHGRNVHRLF